MAKKSQRRPIRYEKDQSGCMWGLISLFDFRNGRTTRKLISDRRHGNKHNGVINTRNKFEPLNNLGENCEGTLALQNGEETATAAGDGKPSVKELMEEEMVCEENRTKEMSNAEVEQEELRLVPEVRTRKTSKKRNKSRSKSSNVEIENLSITDNFASNSSCAQDPKKQTIEDLNIEIMEDCFRQAQQKSLGCEKNSVFEEKIGEAIKELINEKVVDNKQSTEEGNNGYLKELVDAFQILSVDDELLLKLVQDPNSPLGKYVRNWIDTQAKKNGKSDTLTDSNLSEHKPGDLEQAGEHVNHKQRNFFRRKVKSEGKNPSSENDNMLGSRRIVILKPGTTNLECSGTESSHLPSPKSQDTVRNKETNERVGSYLFFTGIRRKLKNAMGKERQEISSGINPSKDQNLKDGEKTIRSDSIGKSSPGKDHFFIERIVKPSASPTRGDKASKGTDSDLSVEKCSKQRVSRIYTEAKRHLSEMVNNGNDSADSSRRRGPKTLGRILSLPEYNLSPINSPRSNLDTPRPSISSGENLQEVSKSTQSDEEENKDSQPGKLTHIKIESCVPVNDSDTKLKALDPTPNLSKENTSDDSVETTTLIIDEITSEGEVEVTRTTEGIFPEDNSQLHRDASCQPISSTTEDDQKKNPSEVQESPENNQMLSPQPWSPSSPSLNEKVDDKEFSIHIQEKPSPVSVLEPLFAEDDKSPARTICEPVELPIQPLQIQFEDGEACVTDKGVHQKTCVQEKGSILEYVKAAFQASQFKWYEPYLRSPSSDRLLDQPFCDELELSNKICHDKKLLLDITNEVFMEIYETYFGCSPWVSFVKPGIRPVPNMRNTILEVHEGVCWHLLQPPLPYNLEKIVRKDMERRGSWMDLRHDAEFIGVGIGEAILEEIVEDTILSCVPENPQKLHENKENLNFEE